MPSSDIPSQPLSRPGKALLLAPWLALGGGFGLAFCLWLIFAFTPIEEVMGVVQKIFYWHLPLAWWGLVSFFLTCIASVLFLRTKNTYWDNLAGASAEVGLLFALLALVLGSFWARSAWGVWWLWDPRLSTTLIMCFIYAGYLIIRHMDMPTVRRAKVAAVVGIVAFLDVPIVYLSARLWRSIHPSTVGLDPDMRLTLWSCVSIFSFFWLGLLFFRHQLALAEERLEELSSLRLMHEEARDDEEVNRLG